MDSDLPSTTPLLQQNGRKFEYSSENVRMSATISPTKLLDFNNNIDDNFDTERKNSFHSDERLQASSTSIYQSNQKFLRSSSSFSNSNHNDMSTDDSFITASSSVDETPTNLSNVSEPNKHVFNTFLSGNNDSVTTLSKHNLINSPHINQENNALPKNTDFIYDRLELNSTNNEKYMGSNYYHEKELSRDATPLIINDHEQVQRDTLQMKQSNDYGKDDTYKPARNAIRTSMLLRNRILKNKSKDQPLENVSEDNGDLLVNDEENYQTLQYSLINDDDLHLNNEISFFEDTINTLNLEDSLSKEDSVSRELSTSPVRYSISSPQGNTLLTPNRDLLGSSTRKRTNSSIGNKFESLNGEKLQSPVNCTISSSSSNDKNQNAESKNDRENSTRAVTLSPSLNKVTSSSSLPTHDNAFDELPHYAYLFIYALHSFNAQSLEDEEDIELCLSFNRNDIAFVHHVDESGWGEVTLIKNQETGWVPFNYFSDIIKYESDVKEYNDLKSLKAFIDSKIPLQSLLASCGKFITDIEKETTSHAIKVNLINDIRDGVKKLLELTDCVSRSNELVQKRDNVKKTRKKLLADWYNLMIKADYYKNNTSGKQLSILKKLVFEVLNRAFTFYSVWSKEKYDYEKEILNSGRSSLLPISPSSITLPESKDETNKNQRKITNSSPTSSNSMLLEPPMAVERLNEIYDILFTYIGLILGRLDMIESNPHACETLEFIVHQIIILLRELLNISKSYSYIVKEKYAYAFDNTLDNNLDPLLSLVSELVSCIKVLVTQTLQDMNTPSPNNGTFRKSSHSSPYRYTAEGRRLIEIASKMAILINNIYFACNNYLRLIGDFQLSDNRTYPDFSHSKLTPEKFISKCNKRKTPEMESNNILRDAYSPTKVDKYSKMARFSSIASFDHQPILQSDFLIDGAAEDKGFGRSSTFEKFKYVEDSKTTTYQLQAINNAELMHEELVFDKDDHLTYASFRAVIYKLTDEFNKPSDSLLVTFLLYFRKFGSIVDFVNDLILRFDVADKDSRHDYNDKNGKYSSKASRLKSRRRLICNIFQRWMESFWSFEDYRILPTLVNFFNEGASNYFPIQSKKLLEICANLFLNIPDNGREFHNLFEDGSMIIKQLKPEPFITSRVSSMISTTSSIDSIRSSVFSLNDCVIEEYGLMGEQTKKNRDSTSLPSPMLNLGTSDLLGKHELEMVRKIIHSYHYILHYDSQKDLNMYATNELIDFWKSLKNRSVDLNILNGELSNSKCSLVDLNPLEVAKQLTVIESNLYLKVKPFELVNFKNSNLAPNINTLLQFTNQFSNYVIETIVAPNLHIEKRCDALKMWLKIALSCVYFRNYNSATTIMTSLQNHAVNRLSIIWKSLEKKDKILFDYLARIVHPNHNFKVYRNKLKLINKDDHYSKSPLPVVPFFNLYLQDLTFLNDGNADYKDPDSFRPNKLLNIDKYIRMTKVISQIQFFQVGYDHSELEELSKRDSFFQLTEQLSIDTNIITHIPLLQQYILLETWRVDVLHQQDRDRSYALSLAIFPKGN